MSIFKIFSLVIFLVFNSACLVETKGIENKREDNEFDLSASETFTVVSYNVENLWDLVEDEGLVYDEYRLTDSEDGEFLASNYGESTYYDQATDITWQQVKEKKILEVLKAIKPTGPEIVALQEVETLAATESLFKLLKEELGYESYYFANSQELRQFHPVGVAVLSKFPLKSAESLRVPYPTYPDVELRPVAKVVYEYAGHELVVYNSHWKRQEGDNEYERIATAKVIEADYASVVLDNPSADVIIMGDFNENANESEWLYELNNKEQNTGINTILKATSNKKLMLDKHNLKSKFNLFYDLPEERMGTYFESGSGKKNPTGWRSYDHIVVSKGLFDNSGWTYENRANSVIVPRYEDEAFSFLFNPATQRPLGWITEESKGRVKHFSSGYSDHLPIFAKFYVKE